jgi:hypothetical protein
MPRQIGLVAAPRARRGGLLQAREQYEPAPLFRRARDYFERGGWEWYVLNASHGLITPRQVVGADGAHVNSLNAEERAAWAREIAARLCELRDGSAGPLVFILLASQSYAELLKRAAPDLELATPLVGLSVSERINWFEERLRIRSRLLGGDGS